jgi:hypothetical protein
MNINDPFGILLLGIILEQRETCEHFINYEIYDLLTKRLQKIYLEKFDTPEVIYGAHDNKLFMKCRGKYYHTYDCSECYKKTIEELKKTMNYPNEETKITRI